jgi:hypothetical protein
MSMRDWVTVVVVVTFGRGGGRFLVERCRRRGRKESAREDFLLAVEAIVLIREGWDGESNRSVVRALVFMRAISLLVTSAMSADSITVLVRVSTSLDGAIARREKEMMIQKERRGIDYCVDWAQIVNERR